MQKLSVAIAAVTPVNKSQGAENQANANVELANAPHAFHTLLKKQAQSNHQATPKSDEVAQMLTRKGLQTAPQTDEANLNAQRVTNSAPDQTATHSSNMDKLQKDDQLLATKAADEMVALLTLPTDSKPVFAEEVKTNEVAVENQQIAAQSASAFAGAMVAGGGLASKLTQEKPATDEMRTQTLAMSLPSQAGNASNSPALPREPISPVPVSEAGATTTNATTPAPDKNIFAKQLAEAKAPMLVSQEKMSEIAGKPDIDKAVSNATTIATIQNTMQPVTVAAAPAAVTPTVASQLPASHLIEADFGKTGWNQAISQRVVWMAGAGEQSATLTLNPPDLGPLQVVVQVHNGLADTTFTSDNADVRQALQDGMEHLREKMRESGVQLGQTNVQSGEQSQRTFEQATQHRTSQNRTAASLTTDDVATQQKPMMRVSNGLVDTFA